MHFICVWMCMYMLFPWNSKAIPKVLSRTSEYLHKNLLMISSKEYKNHFYSSFYICYQNPGKYLNTFGDRKKISRDSPLKLSLLIFVTFILQVALTSSYHASVFVTPDLSLASNLPYSLCHCICCCQISSDL